MSDNTDDADEILLCDACESEFMRRNVAENAWRCPGCDADMSCHDDGSDIMGRNK